MLRVGAKCNLLPGDKVYFFGENTKIVNVARMHNTRSMEFSWRNFKSILKIGRSETCPLRARGKVAKRYRKLWGDYYVSIESQKALQSGK